MLNRVYECATGRFIHCYTATTTSVFIAESSLEEPWKVQLLCLREGKTNTLQYPIQITRSSFEQDFASRVKNLIITSVPHFDTSVGLEPWFYLVVHTSDGIQVCSLPELIKGSCKKLHKWTHDNSKDTITSCYAQGNKEKRILVTYATITGQLVQFAFDVQTETFIKLPLPRGLSQVQDRIMDRLNNITGLRNENYPEDVQEQLWAHQSDLALSCLDNTLYTVVERKLECQPIYDLQEEELCLWADLAIAKRYKNSSLRFFVVNISNVGCLLYKRSNGGKWELLETLPREKNFREKSPLVDCLIMLVQRRHTLRILSGSENGMLYQWDYDYGDNTVVNENELHITDGIVHSLSVIREKVFLLHNSNTCISYVMLP